MSDEQDKDGAYDETVEAIRYLGAEETIDAPPLRFAASDDMPHWSNPPTGENPPVFSEEASSDDLDAWSAFGTAPVWREDSSEDSFDHLADLTSEVPLKVAASGDPDDFFAALEPEPPAKVTSISSRQRTAPPGTGRRPDVDASPGTAGAGGRNMPVAIGVGVVLVGAALALFKAGPRYGLILIVAILIAAVVEYFDALRRAKYQPATLVGLVATGLMPVAAYNEGTRGVVLVLAFAVFASLVWFVLVDSEARPTVNAALTLTGVVWVGFLGSFAGLILAVRDPATGADDGIGILLACIAGTVAHDVCALAGGSIAGRSPLAPRISPNKTWEGLICGMVGAIVVPVLLSNFLHPWKDDWANAAYLGIAIALTAPLGDLVESLVKRDLGVKDMGTLLPGHGGVFDRFDAFLFTLPATWYLIEVLHIP